MLNASVTDSKKVKDAFVKTLLTKLTSRSKTHHVMRHNLELPHHNVCGSSRDTDSPTRQTRSMSVAVPVDPTPMLVTKTTSRPRTNSLPSPAFLLGFRGCRDPRTCVSVRSFTTTAKGVINAGDIVRQTGINNFMSSGSAVGGDDRRKSCVPSCVSAANRGKTSASERLRTSSLASTDSSSSSGSHNTSTFHQQRTVKTGVSYFRVAIQGDEGVGKTSLTRQFSSSEYLGTYDNATPNDGDLTETTIVPVLLDGEESIMEFTDGADAYQADDINVDAYVVVFSIVDRNSFLVSKDLARQLRVNLGTDRAIILVGNKSDLVRKRQVTTEEAKYVADTFDCKYIETSAALNHKVDDLVAGTLTLMRRQLLPPSPSYLPLPQAKCRSRTPSPVSFFNKLFKKSIKTSMSCEGIFMK